jgi:hypothetical protein
LLNGRAPLLHVAAFYGSVGCFNFLRACHADPHLRERSKKRRGLAEFAAVGGNGEILRNCERLAIQTPHFQGVSFQRNEIFFWTIGRGMDLEDQSEVTLMDRAAPSSNIEVVRFLYENGKKARLEKQNGSKSTFAIACLFHCLAAVSERFGNEEVLRKGSEEAVQAESEDVVEFLQGKMKGRNREEAMNDW